MTFKIKLDKKTKALLRPKDKNGLLATVRKDFTKTAPKQIKRVVENDMLKGISPVKGVGKWQRYSKSYKETIRGKFTYRNIGGKVIRFKGKDREYHSKASPTKQIAPVNLRHSGKLINSFKVFTSGGFLRGFRLNFQFKNFLADIHNRRGASKSKVVRRMLPTEKGEEFNKVITDAILLRLKRSALNVARQFSRR